MSVTNSAQSDDGAEHLANDAGLQGNGTGIAEVAIFAPACELLVAPVSGEMTPNPHIDTDAQTAALCFLFGRRSCASLSVRFGEMASSDA